jgi:eukaryotic-like serine/threonine-protein kinase
MSDDALGLAGTTIADKYDVEAVVGEGGFAVVYRATHRLWKRPVALKVFKALADLPEQAREELTQNFIREGALLAELSEKTASICQARDVGVLTTPDGATVPYMVLEWLEGETLEDALDREGLLEEPPRTIEETVRLLAPIAQALALAHARGIAHRDVKPANIFLVGRARDRDCAVKLLDFGIAKVVQDLQKAGGAFTKTTGTLSSFTPAYAAPEQFSKSHGPTGPWTDVFSLALVAVELVTGKPPLDGETFVQLGYSAGNAAKRPTPRTKGVTTSDAVEAVFQKALAVERTARYASADAFWNDLAAAAGGRDSLALGSTAPSLEAVRPVDSAPDVDVAARTLTAPSMVTTGTAASATVSESRASSKAPLLAAAGIVAAAGVAFLFRGQLNAGGAGAAPGASLTTASAPLPLASASVASAAPAVSAPLAARCPEGMLYLPGGLFFMGSDDDTPAEKPAHQVKVAPYCMDTFEVTTKKYVACSDGGWCKRAATTNVGTGLKPAEEAVYDGLCNERDPVGKADHPINCVTWEMADVYCHAMKARLPTEAEWEFAARGSDGRRYPWGDEAPSAKYLNACGSECMAWATAAKVPPLTAMYNAADGFPNTAPVGSFPQGRSKFGVMDLAGNVWEWVSDWYGPYTSTAGHTPADNPKGPDKGDTKVLRGGGWNGSDPSWERPSFRFSTDPSHRNYAFGFRCAADPK